MGVGYGSIVNGAGISLANNGQLDAFNRLRVSNPTGIFSSQSQYDAQPLIFEQITSGTGSITHQANRASLLLDTGGTASGALAAVQTYQYMRYQPGKSQFMFLTFKCGVPLTNIRRRVGYFDVANGAFLELAEDGVTNFVVRSSVSGSPVDTKIPQSTWNFDAFNGTGKSKITLDLEKVQIFWIDLEWLGVGRVRFGFVINGQVFIAHEQNHANLIESVYMTTANLPVRYEIENVGVPASNGTFEPICSSVISEGGFEEERAYQFSDVSAALTVTTTTTPLVAIRQKATFNSIVSRGLVLPISLEALTTGTGSAIWELIFVPHSGSVVGGAWASVGASSICDVNKTATSLTGGIVVESGFYTSTVQAKSGIQRGLSLRAPMGWNHDATTYSSWVLAARTITGTLATLGSLTWKEIR